MDPSRYSQSSSQHRQRNDKSIPRNVPDKDIPAEDAVVLGSLLSRKSWSNSLHRHLPFNNRWKERYFVIENSDVLSIISSGRRMNLLIRQLIVRNHEYSPDGTYVLTLSYYTGNNNQNNSNILQQNILQQNILFQNNYSCSPAFITSHTKQLEIQLQFVDSQNMRNCKENLLYAINKQKIETDQITEMAIRSICMVLKRKLLTQVSYFHFIFSVFLFFCFLFF